MPLPRPLPPIRLTGATILRDGELRQRAVALAHGRITKGPLPAVDLSGYLVLPGIVDLLMLPAPGSTAKDRVRATLTLAARSGMTTAWLAPAWSWDGGFNAPHAARDILAAITPHGLPDLRPALRIETHRPEMTAAISEFITAARPELAWFESDFARLHDLARDIDAFTPEATRLGHLPATLRAALDAASGRLREVPRHLCRIAETFEKVGTRFGSIGDSNGAMRETHSMIGASIAASPTAHSAAAAARAMGDPVLLSAAHPARLAEMLHAGLGSAIISHDAPQRMAPLAVELARDLPGGLARIWSLMSYEPAQMMGLSDRGHLDHGARADLVVISPQSGRVEATIANGRLLYLSAALRDRFRPVLPDDGMRIAAE